MGRIDGVEARQGCRVVREIEAGTEPDFQYRAVDSREHQRALFLKLLASHHPLHQVWEYVLAIPSHSCLSV